MGKVRTALWLILGLVWSPAFAQDPFWVGSVDDGAGNKAANVLTFDWASSGSGNAAGVGPAGSPLEVGKTFVFRYQSFLVDLTAPDGGKVALPGLNTDFEYTFVAQFPEIVVGVTGTTAIFSTLSGGTFHIYWDGERNADVPSGLGFDDGTLVASGIIEADQISMFTQTSAAQGNGSFILEGLIDFVNPDFFDDHRKIFDIRFEGTLNLPPLDSETSAFFASRDPEGYYDTYTVASTDVTFKVDASHKFTQREVAPENCRVTAGGVKEVGDELVTLICSTKPNGQIDPKTCATESTPKAKNSLAFKDTWGGQAGASGIDGNWTHHHQVSPQQSFVFHSNEVNKIICSDEGVPCTPAGANATHRQIDFEGSGRFVNQKGYSFPEGNLCYTVHLEDIGEPGPGGKWPSSTLACTHTPGTIINPLNDNADCMNCTDYYEIRIFGNAACTGDPIYVNGVSSLPSPLGGYFITSGNVQMHPGK